MNRQTNRQRLIIIIVLHYSVVDAALATWTGENLPGSHWGAQFVEHLYVIYSTRIEYIFHNVVIVFFLLTYWKQLIRPVHSTLHLWGLVKNKIDTDKRSENKNQRNRDPDHQNAMF